MLALLLSLSTVASAAELAPASLFESGIAVASPDGLEIQGEFDHRPVGELHPGMWVDPGHELLAWGAFLEGDEMVEGLVWLEIEDQSQSPFLLVVSDRQESPFLVEYGPGQLVGWLEGDTSSFDGWPVEALDLLLEASEQAAYGPSDEDGGEVTVEASHMVLVVLLPGCGPGRDEGVTEDNGLSDEDKREIEEEAEKEKEDGDDTEDGVED